MERRDIAVALGMVVACAPVGDAKLAMNIDIPRRRKLRAVVSRQRQTHSTKTERQSIQVTGVLSHE
jgi:hypothetical protein